MGRRTARRKPPDSDAAFLQNACAAGAGLAYSRRGCLLDALACSLLCFQTNFPEGRFILLQVLQQEVRKRLGLRRAEKNALIVLNGDRVRSGLIDGAEKKKEVP